MPCHLIRPNTPSALLYKRLHLLSASLFTFKIEAYQPGRMAS